MTEPAETRFRCPNCGAQYKVVRVEAAADAADAVEVTCINCDAPFISRDGRFALKYFLVDAKRPRGRRKR